MSELVENVARAVRPHLYAEGGNSEDVARAAIAAVAEWLKEKNYKTTHVPDWPTVAQILRQLEQPK